MLARKLNSIGKIAVRGSDRGMFAETIHSHLRQPIRKLGDLWGRSMVLLKVFDHATFLHDPVQHPEEDRYAGAPETIDRLLRITDDHQLSWGKAAGTIGIFGQKRNDLGLNLVGVLKFVDQQ